MKCPKCSTETPSEALCCPGCKLVTPKGRSYKKSKDIRQQVQTTRAEAREKADEIKGPKKIGPVIIGLSVLMTVLICGLGSYFLLTYWETTRPVLDNHPQLALEKIRFQPSKHQGLNVEECLNQEVERARKAGQLLEAEGWDVRPIQGARFLVSFTYQLKDKAQQQARWEVDIAENTFAPKTQLATAVYGN